MRRTKTSLTPPILTIDTSQYNRHLELSVGERGQIVTFSSRNRQTASSYSEIISSKKLARLVKPIVDVFDLAETVGHPYSSHEHRCHALMFMLCEMGRRQSAYWAWTSNEWARVLCGNTDDFCRRYKSASFYRPLLINVAYFLGGFTDFFLTGNYIRYNHAAGFFGKEAVDESLGHVNEQLHSWGFSQAGITKVSKAICEIMIYNCSPRLEDITSELLIELRKQATGKRNRSGRKLKHTCLIKFLPITAEVLAGMGVISEPLQREVTPRHLRADHRESGVSMEWERWCNLWVKTATLRPATIRTTRHSILLAGRWLKAERPEIKNPAHWIRTTAAEFVAALCKSRVGQWPVISNKKEKGKTFSPNAISSYLSDMRRFFRDCQEWEWIPRRFDPRRAFATPRSVSGLLKLSPKVIDDLTWVKLIHAGITLTAEDLLRESSSPRSRAKRHNYYPIEMVRALAMVWLFAGLRNDEIIRLRVGCAARRVDRTIIRGNAEAVARGTLCFMEVPANKTSNSYVKPLDAAVGDAIAEWERVRPAAPASIDDKTSESVNYLFTYRLRRVGRPYINQTLIPLLCGKAGVAETDSLGAITSHRARATVATKLANGDSPMKVQEISSWLGHKNIESTLHYVSRPHEQLARSYEAAEFLSNSLRQLHTLTEPVVPEKSGATSGELVSTKLLEIKESLAHLRQILTLPSEEAATLDNNIELLGQLCATLNS
jgi:integrase